MNEQLWQRVDSIFNQALTVPQEDRTSFVKGACGDDKELHAEVSSLLEHHTDVPEGFLRSVVRSDGSGADDGACELVGQKIGKYSIERVIASGGMSTVYEAQQENPQRRVALKITPVGVPGRQHARWMQRESQVLARLQHANIAHVYEAGTERIGGGMLAYFAMELVQGGIAITDYAVRHELSTRDRLLLFCKICDAVHHGHQKGVIHRDLKPANILVDAVAEPKVIDFGVARITDSDIATATQHASVGLIVGTIQYMSPEQCDADALAIDIRSDVYSLGVVLYELLAACLPYDCDGTTIYKATQVIRESAPRSLSGFDRRLRGDLEIIVHKAIEKDRERRYGSADDLARDIRRYLNREPIEARPPTTWSRGLRWALRHPRATTLGACLLIAVLALGSTSLATWAYSLRPHRMVLEMDGRQARLLSMGGFPLKNWVEETSSSISLAELVRQPAEYGGRQLAVLGFSEVAHNSRYPASLVAFDINEDLEVPLWERRISADDLARGPDTGHFVDPTECSVQPGLVADFFPDRPGQEILAIFVYGNWSPRIIRIYDLQGELLYQTWHDGSIGSVHWMYDVQLLILSGYNSEVPWPQRDHPDASRIDERWAWVVYALRPEDGLISNDRVSPQGSRDAEVEAVWYKALLPVSALNSVSDVQLQRPQPHYQPGRTVYVRVDAPDTYGGVGWVIDEHGDEIVDESKTGHGRQYTRVVDDDYKKRLAELPDPYSFTLSPLPPKK